MHEQIAISNALVAIAGSILVGAGALVDSDPGGLLVIVGSFIGVYGLYKWFADVHLARRAAADRVMNESVQEFREKHERPTSGS